MGKRIRRQINCIYSIICVLYTNIMWSLHINNPVETYSDRSYPGWGPHLVVFFSTATFLLLGPNSLVCCLHVNSYYMWVLYTTCHSILLNIPQLCYSFVYITLILAYISWGKYTSMGVERFLSSFSFSLIRSIHYFQTNFHKQNRLTRKIISIFTLSTLMDRFTIRVSEG